MVAVTPDAKNHDGLDALASRYVDVGNLPWRKTRFPGVETKVLMEDKETVLSVVRHLHAHLEVPCFTHKPTPCIHTAQSSCEPCG